MNETNTKLLTNLEGAMRAVGLKQAGRAGRRRADALYKIAQTRGLLALLASGKIQGWPVLTEYLKREKERKEKERAELQEKIKHMWGNFAHLGVDEKVYPGPKVDEKPTAG